jgi:molecular chaperone DnaK (HSP70)
MRKSNFSLLFLASALFFLPACKSKKEVPTKSITPEQAGEVEVKLYCSGSEYFSTKEILRANAVGESMDQNTSKKKALNEARTQLASSINTVLKATIDNYVNSREFNNKEEIQERFEGLSREVINQELSGTRIICEKLTKTSQNTYKTYLALELSGTDMIKNLGSKLGQDERLRIDYDYEKFKNTFDQEMEKFEKSRR